MSFSSGRPSERTRFHETCSHRGSCGLRGAGRDIAAQRRPRSPPRLQLRRTRCAPATRSVRRRLPQLERIRVVAGRPPRCCRSKNSTCPARSKPCPRGSRRSRCRCAGRVRQVMVTLGDHVRSGQTLLTVETPESSTLQSALRQARADVTHRQAAVAKAEADVSRVRDLLANRAIAQKDVHRGGHLARRSHGGPGAGARDRGRCDAAAALARRRRRKAGGWSPSARRWTAKSRKSPSPPASIAATPPRRS